MVKVGLKKLLLLFNLFVMKKYYIDFETRFELTKKWILSKHPSAKIQGLGSNNIVEGIWYKTPGNKLRSFTPLLDL